MNKQRNKIVLVLSLMLLAACQTPSSSEPASDVPSTSSGTSVIQSESPSTSSETSSMPSSEVPSSENDYELDLLYTTSQWPEAAISYVLEGLNVTVPGFVSETDFSYMLIEDEDGLYIAISTEVATIASEDVYSDALRDAFWVIDETYYEEYGFFATDAESKVNIQYFWYEGEFVWYIYPALVDENPSEPEEPGSGEVPVELESAVWPEAAITSYLGEEITTSIPSLSSDKSYYYGVASEEGVEFFFVYTEMPATEVASGYFDVEETYNALLVNAGWVIDAVDYADYGFFAVDAAETVVLQYYWWDGFFYWYVMPYEEEPALPGEVALDGVATFDLLTENALVLKDGNSSVWVVAPATMTITKGTSTVNVGNTSFFSNPLRVYTNQVVAFSVEEGYQIDSIVIHVNASNSSYVTALTSSAFTNATASVSGQAVSLSLTDKTSAVEILISGQTRFDSVVITLSEIA